jgi:hypothetical protein
VNRHEFLSQLHKTYRPRNYLEIGVNDGRSLTLSRVPSVAVDPAFKVTAELACDVHLVRETSDDFFRRKNPLVHLAGGRNPVRKIARKDPALIFTKPTLELSFIDGMHLFEFALRDFINVERNARWSSVVVFDDMLPRQVDHAARDRHTRLWTGDVFKIVPVLRTYRPDLTLLLADTAPTGLLLVLGLDPGSTVLQDNYDAILAEHVVPDPQVVPEDVLSRKGALDPARLLRSPVWGALRRGRRPWEGREHVLGEISTALDDPRAYRAKRRQYRRTAQRAVRGVVKRLPAPSAVRTGG